MRGVAAITACCGVSSLTSTYLRLARLRRYLGDIRRKARLAQFETMRKSRQRQFARPRAQRLAVDQQLGIGRLTADTNHADTRHEFYPQRCAATAAEIHAA